MDILFDIIHNSWVLSATGIYWSLGKVRSYYLSMWCC